MNEEIERVLDTQVRPLLRTHGGDLEVLGVEEGVVRFKLLGRCVGCPAADLTSQELVETALTEHVPGVTRAVLVQEVSEDLLAQAREILRQKRGEG